MEYPSRAQPAPSAWPGSALLALALGALALALRPTALTLPRFYASDSGVFYVVFDRLASGARLYAEVFDHKDPLFYAFYTVAYALIGIDGPMLWETALTLGALALAVLVARQAGLGLAGQLLAGLGFFAFFLHPAAYFPIHSNHQAIALALGALAAGLARRDRLAGVLMAAVLLTKLTHALYLPALVLCILAFDPHPLNRAALVRVLRMGIAALVVVSLSMLALLSTGTLAGYLDVLRVNVDYQAQYDQIQARFWRGTPSGPVEMLREQMSPALLGVHAALFALGALSLFVPARLQEGRRARAVLLTSAGLASVAATALILDSSYAWPHYYEVLALPALLTALAGLTAIRRLLDNFWFGAAAIALYLTAGILSGALSTLPSYVGWVEGQRRSDTQEQNLRPCIVEQMRAAGATAFATIGSNRPVQAARLVAPGARLVCRAFYQFPWFSGPILDEFLRCIATGEPEIIFQRDVDFPLDIDRPLAAALRDRYAVQANCGDITVLRRR